MRPGTLVVTVDVMVDVAEVDTDVEAVEDAEEV
jgi:hypothetical protein